jgi:hypothetical protein
MSFHLSFLGQTTQAMDFLLFRMSNVGISSVRALSRFVNLFSQNLLVRCTADCQGALRAKHPFSEHPDRTQVF